MTTKTQLALLLLQSYHIIPEIYSAPITKKNYTTGALQKSAKC